MNNSNKQRKLPFDCEGNHRNYGHMRDQLGYECKESTAQTTKWPRILIPQQEDLHRHHYKIVVNSSIQFKRMAH